MNISLLRTKCIMRAIFSKVYVFIAHFPVKSGDLNVLRNVQKQRYILIYFYRTLGINAKAITEPACTARVLWNLKPEFYFPSDFCFSKTRVTIYRCCRSSFVFMILSHIYNISSVLYKSVSWNVLCFLFFLGQDHMFDGSCVILPPRVSLIRGFTVINA